MVGRADLAAGAPGVGGAPGTAHARVADVAARDGTALGVERAGAADAEGTHLSRVALRARRTRGAEAGLADQARRAPGVGGACRDTRPGTAGHSGAALGAPDGTGAALARDARLSGGALGVVGAGDAVARNASEAAAAPGVARAASLADARAIAYVARDEAAALSVRGTRPAETAGTHLARRALRARRASNATPR